MNWDWKQLVLVVLLVVMLLALRKLGGRKGKESRAARMMKQYGHMTRETFDAIPEGERVDAVISRVLARAEEERRPDPVQALAELGNGSTVVYSVWAVCREMAAADGEALMASPTAAVADLAAESFRAIGASACGDTFAALASLLKDAAHADRTVLAEAEQAFRQAVQTECPLTLCESYIGDHADEFIDPPPAETV